MSQTEVVVPAPGSLIEASRQEQTADTVQASLQGKLMNLEDDQEIVVTYQLLINDQEFNKINYLIDLVIEVLTPSTEIVAP